MNKSPNRNLKQLSSVDLIENPHLFLFSTLGIQSLELEDGNVKQQQQENLVFADAGMADSHTVPMVSYRPDCDLQASLGSYLQRPVAINTFSWVEGSTTIPQLSFNPWGLYFNTTAIKNKINNYARLRAKLHLKFVINASPFYYGALRVCYNPIDSANRALTVSAGDQIMFSQMPGDFLYPADMTSMEMELPFLWPHAWLDVGVLNDFNTMGTIHYYLYSQLRSANGATGQNVTITCYAWATDVELAGLTSGLSLQADEYDDVGPISGPATAVANVAAKLVGAPVIGPLARATEIGARAVGGIASLFGYSNPPVINDVHAFVPKAFHTFSSVETSMPMDKLTIDPKNEITVDKTVTGASAEDPLVISDFCARSSYVISLLWTDAYAPGTQLLRIPVTPRNYASNAGVNQNYINSTPAAHAASMFSQWRGGMIYTLKFVKSRYHTGRVQISWDPSTVPLTNAETTTVTRIVDLQMETEVEFIIPFKAQDPWLKTSNTGSNWAITTGGTVTTDPDAFNGYIRVTVLNELTGPANSQQIDVLLFARTAPDFQLSVPAELPQWSYLTVQSLEVEELAKTADISIPPDTNAITVGETIRSLRTLLHRTTYYHREFLGNPFASSGVYYAKNLFYLVNYIPRFPTEFGFNPDGVNYAIGLTVANKSQFQFSPNHPINWLANCFAGYRGGIVHQYNTIANGHALPDELSVERDQTSHILDVAPRQAINRFTVGVTSAQQSDLARLAVTTTFGVGRAIQGHRGMAITNTNTQSALSVVTPQYSKWKFRPAYLFGRDAVPNEMEKESIKVSTIMRVGSAGGSDEGWPALSIFMSAGVDFDLIYFICVPRMYSFAMPTADNTF